MLLICRSNNPLQMKQQPSPEDPVPLNAISNTISLRLQLARLCPKSPVRRLTTPEMGQG